MNLKSATIYWIHLPEHTDPLTEGYIGVTRDLNIRLKGHISDISKGKHKNPHLINAVKKYGWDNLIKESLLFGEEAYCYEIEEEMRPKKATGWNVAPGGHRGPGWIKGKKRSQESIDRQKASMELINVEKRKIKFQKRELRLKEREQKRIDKEKLKEEKKAARLLKKQQHLIKEENRKVERERRRVKRLNEDSQQVSNEYITRPLCKSCNKNHSAINYVRVGVTHYRSICDECGRKKNKLKPRKPNWIKSGYNKKPTCDLCGFRSKYGTQITVYHIDGNLENISLNNLRSICLNCVEVVKHTHVTWRRGDLQVDY